MPTQCGHNPLTNQVPQQSAAIFGAGHHMRIIASQTTAQREMLVLVALIRGKTRTA